MSARLTAAMLGALIAAWLPGCKSKDSAPAEATGAAGRTSQPLTGPARLALERHFVDAGILEPQTTHERTVAIRNIGGRELIIEEARIACPCFKASFDRKRLGPDESAHITASFLTLNHRGVVRETIGIVSNDPARVQTLTLRFEVSHELIASPDRLYLGFARPGQTLRGQVKIVANVDVDTKVLYAVSGGESLVGRVIDPALRKDKPATLEAVLKSPAKPGTYTYDLTVITAYEKAPSLRLPVMVSVSESASVSPDRLDFGRFSKGASIARQIDLSIGQGTRLKAVTARPEVLDISVDPADPEGAVKLRLTPSRGAPHGPLGGEVRLELAGKENCTLAVPFAGYVADEPGP